MACVRDEVCPAILVFLDDTFTPVHTARSYRWVSFSMFEHGRGNLFIAEWQRAAFLFDTQ